jgi:hypothetical protein
MQQSSLALRHGIEATDPVERVGFQLGWDHAHHGLVPPPGLLLDGTPVGQGWRAGKAVFGVRTLAATQAVRQWLDLRTRAWHEGVAFEDAQLTAHVLAQLRVERCPVRRVRHGGAAGDTAAPVFDRLNPDAGYAAGNVVQISAGAARARAGIDLLESVRRARRLEAGADPVDGLDAGAWWRLAVLRSFATPLPFFEAARLPLALIPPNRVRLLNTVQGLQALLTLQFTAPGWGARLRTVAEALPEHTLRHDFNLWIGTLVPRALEATRQQSDLRIALEDAWLSERVQRRWQHFTLSLGEPGVVPLLERAAAIPLPGRSTLQHAAARATEGWALESGGRLRTQGAAPAVAPAPAIRRRTDRPPSRPAPRATAASQRAAT